MEWNDGTDSSMQKKKTTTEEKKREWVEEPVKPETLFSVAFPSSALLLFLFFSVFLCVCFCFLTAIKLQFALVGASKRKIHKYTNVRSKNDSIVESIDTAKHKQLVNSIRKQNHQRSLNFSMLEIVCELHS